MIKGIKYGIIEGKNIGTIFLGSDSIFSWRKRHPAWSCPNLNILYAKNSSDSFKYVFGSILRIILLLDVIAMTISSCVIEGISPFFL